MKKILLILLGIVTLNLCAHAIESDFKNSLLKVDYVKTGADSYNIRLFTQKPYSEPIKVIKKTNTNYYILLPETFHSIGSVAPTGDIKSTEVKLFPYAGQDLNNGYTKINIFTSKPLNITAQLNSSKGAVAPSIDPKKLSQLDSAFNTKQAQANEAQRQAQYAAQQKQLAAQQEAQRQAQLKAQQEAQARAAAQRQAQIKAQQEAQARAQAQREAQARAQQEAQRQAQLKAQQEAQARAAAQRQAQIKAQQEAQARAQAQREAQLRAQQEAKAKAQQEAQARAQAQQEAQRQAQIKAQQEAQTQRKVQDTNNLEVLDNAGIKYEQDANEKKFDTESINEAPIESLNQDKQDTISQDLNDSQELNNLPAQNFDTIVKIKNIIKNKFSFVKPYYYIVKDNLILFSAIAIAFIGILLLVAIGKNKKKGTVETMESQNNSNQTDKKDEEIETIETNIFNTPMQTQNADENNSISFVEESKEFPSEKEAIEETKEEEYVEPEIISSVEIASNRGFMIIEQQGTKALFGYIYDNVYLLYQFREFVSNYEIKFRISEKQENRTFFIVKIDNIKLLVRVTNSSMKLELEM